MRKIASAMRNGFELSFPSLIRCPKLEGLVLEGEGALWRAEELARARGAAPAVMEQVVVAVDGLKKARKEQQPCRQNFV